MENLSQKNGAMMLSARQIHRGFLSCNKKLGRQGGTPDDTQRREKRSPGKLSLLGDGERRLLTSYTSPGNEKGMGAKRTRLHQIVTLQTSGGKKVMRRAVEESVWDRCMKESTFNFWKNRCNGSEKKHKGPRDIDIRGDVVSKLSSKGYSY